MKSDVTTKVLLAFVGSGLWAVALVLGHHLPSVQAAKAAGVPGVVTARKFVVVDAKGRARIVLNSLDEGYTGLTINDTNGKPSVRVRADNIGSEISLFHKGQARAELSTAPEFSQVSLCDGRGRSRIGLMARNGSLSERNDGPGMYMYDTDGRLYQYQRP